MSFVAFDIRRLDVVEGEVAALLVTEFGHPPEKVGVDRRVPGLNANKSEPRHLRLLRTRRERQRDRRRAAEGSQQFPSSDGDCHTPLPREARKGNGTTPRACSLAIQGGRMLVASPHVCVFNCPPPASSWRTLPWQPRTSARSRRSASGLRGGHRPASTAMGGLSARPWPRPMPRALAARASALAAWRSTARSPRGRHPSTAPPRVLPGRTQGSALRSLRRR